MKIVVMRAVGSCENFRAHAKNLLECRLIQHVGGRAQGDHFAATDETDDIGVTGDGVQIVDGQRYAVPIPRQLRPFGALGRVVLQPEVPVLGYE